MSSILVETKIGRRNHENFRTFISKLLDNLNITKVFVVHTVDLDEPPRPREYPRPRPT